MNKLVILLRFLQFYAHIAHHLVSGNDFFENHEFFGKLYKEYEDEYDSVVERMIGLNLSLDLFKLQSQACAMLSNLKFTDASQAFKEILKYEKTLVSVIESIIWPRPMSHPHADPETSSQGLVQLLGDISNKSEQRQYFLQQKTK